MKEKLEGLGQAWIILHENIRKYGRESKETDEVFWAHEGLYELCETAPRDALDLINYVVNSTDDEFLLANLAAGPVEELLCFHGQLLIEEIERTASTSYKFRSLLRNVWKNEINEQVWERVQRAAKAV